MTLPILKRSIQFSRFERRDPNSPGSFVGLEIPS